MQPADLAELKTRIEEALAASTEELGSDTPAVDAPAEYVVPLEGTAAHLVNIECTRAALTDHAVRHLGGRQFAVDVQEGRETREGRITIRVPHRGRVAPPLPAWTSEDGIGNGECLFDPIVERQITTTPVGPGTPGLQMPDGDYDRDEANGGEHRA